MTAIVHQLKSNLRKDIKQRLTKMNPSNRDHQSLNVAQQLFLCRKYKESQRIGVYLSLPEEVATYNIVEHILNDGKECFIPRYNKFEMNMVKLRSIKDLKSLPETSWKIKQPLATEEREEACSTGGLDYIIVPGLAFTIEGHRLGRGKGYYDKYFDKLKLNCKEANRKPVFAVGLAFKEQIVDKIPTSEYDYKLDKVLYTE